MSLRHAILGVLEYQPLHGYALKCVLEQGISSFWPVNLPAIYPCLRRLEEEGLVRHEREATREGRPDRKVFHVTEAGREEMTRWRRVPPDTEIPRFRNGLFLKLLFAKRENLADAQAWIAREVGECQKRLEQLRQRIAEGGDEPFFVGFLRESGMAHLELHIERLGDLAAQIERIRDGDGERESSTPVLFSVSSSDSSSSF